MTSFTTHVLDLSFAIDHDEVFYSKIKKTNIGKKVIKNTRTLPRVKSGVSCVPVSSDASRIIFGVSPFRREAGKDKGKGGEKKKGC